MAEWQGLPFDDDPSDEPVAPAAPPEPPEPKGPLTVGELTARLKTLVETGIGAVEVEGQVSNHRPHPSGHLYFTLKDERAQIRAVMFRSDARRLTFRLEDGQHIVARGRLSVYEVRGEYQIICDRLAPHGLGALQLAFEQLKKRLAAEGLFAAERKRPLPVLPRKIGVVTSLSGAALQDILRVLTARYPEAHIVLRDARVQGDGAPEDLIRGLRAIEQVEGVDVIIIGRGGGSAEDLWAFNNEALARAIVACRVPVISAVGHEVDFTISDFVADVRAATPSNAAELVVDRADAFRARSRPCSAAWLAPEGGSTNCVGDWKPVTYAVSPPGGNCGWPTPMRGSVTRYRRAGRPSISARASWRPDSTRSVRWPCWDAATRCAGTTTRQVSFDQPAAYSRATACA
jgi:hypothetical protein